MLAAVLADLVDGDDVGVLQIGGGLGLAEEPLHFVRAGQGAGADHLEGHVRFRLVCRAFQTTPMPPRAISSSSS